MSLSFIGGIITYPVRIYIVGTQSSYTVDYEQFVNQTLTPYISAVRNVAIATIAAAAVVIATVTVGRLLGRAWLRRLYKMSTENKLDYRAIVAGSVLDDAQFEGHLDDLCECHVTSAVTSPAAGPLLHPCNYSETIV